MRRWNSGWSRETCLKILEWTNNVDIIQITVSSQGSSKASLLQFAWTGYKIDALIQIQYMKQDFYAVQQISQCQPKHLVEFFLEFESDSQIIEIDWFLALQSADKK